MPPEKGSGIYNLFMSVILYKFTMKKFAEIPNQGTGSFKKVAEMSVLCYFSA